MADVFVAVALRAAILVFILSLRFLEIEATDFPASIRHKLIQNVAYVVNLTDAVDDYDYKKDIYEIQGYNNSLTFQGKTKRAKLNDVVSKNITMVLENLLKNYEHSQLPTHGTGVPTLVQTNILIRSMGPVSELDMDYSMDCYFRQYWRDPRLSFLGPIKSLSLSIKMLERIWRPDTYFYNGKNSYVHTITVPNKLLRITQDGDILYSMRLTIKAKCPMELRNFPMDRQSCPLILGSYAYTRQQLEYQWQNSDSVTFVPGMTLSQFDLISVPYRNFTFTRREGDFSVLQVSFNLQRHTGYFLIQVYVPCILIVVLSWVSFWIHREATSDRVGLGITTVLTLSTISLDSRTDLPKVRYATALDWFLLMSFFYCIATLLEFAGVHYFTKVGSGELRVEDEEWEDAGTTVEVGGVMSTNAGVMSGTVVDERQNARRRNSLICPIYNRRSSVSFSRHGSGLSDEDIQISLAPYIQTYLAYSGRRASCCGVPLPLAFERSADGSWWDPRFDSDILEGQYRASAFPQIRLRFRYALRYVIVCTLLWFVYFLSSGLTGTVTHWPLICAILVLLFLFVCSVQWLTYHDFYRVHMFKISLIVSLLLCTVSLCFLAISSELLGHSKHFILSSVGHFSICIEILLLIYTVVPLPLYTSVIVCGIYSVMFEILTCFVQPDTTSTHIISYVFIRVLLQFSIHLIGLHILTMTVVRMRGTFMKVGQSLLVRRQLEMEKQLKEKMIHSVMPPKVADWLMTENSIGESENLKFHLSPRNSNPADLKSLFRPFNMNCMENVSILFADIVGFTRMSSNKTAEQLVGILNDLFEKFDRLCTMNGCEKISTLGDCYYCVSGCPEPRPDHATCCVEMGLGIIAAMAEFDAERHEGVTMRVGVHTGTVLCGIVGTRRFKFDVWSNDVTLANRMESTGRPEHVHISEVTCGFLGDAYLLEDGDIVHGHKTYFIKGRRSDADINQTNLNTLNVDSKTSEFDCLQLVISPPSTPNSRHNSLSLLKSMNSNHIMNSFSQTSTNPFIVRSHYNTPNLSPNTPNLSPNTPNLSPNTPNISPNLIPSINVSQELPILAKTTNNLSPNNQSLYNSQTSSMSSRSPSNISSNLSQNSNVLKNSTCRSPNLFKISDQSPIPSPSSSPRPRLASCNKLPQHNHMDNQFLSPNPFKIKANSLPSILDSDTEQERIEVEKLSNAPNPKDRRCNKNTRKTWKIPKFLRKTDEIKTDVDCKNNPVTDVLLPGNGYQQLPIVMETHTSADQRLLNGEGCPEKYNGRERSPKSNFDVIDLRSYINQSRSDVSAFARTNSYKSHCGRSRNVEVMPLERARSATVAGRGESFVRRHYNSSLRVPGDDSQSVAQSVGSRKDSGITSNSRRSSIQQQIYAMNQSALSQGDILHHRVSGYYTSSQSSLDEPAHSKSVHLAPPPDHLGACFQKLRKQSDLQLIRCVQDNVKSQRSYFVKPPLKKFSLFFRSREMEQEFRSKAHLMGERNSESLPTLATSKFNTHIDVLVSAMIYTVVAISMFLLYPLNKVWICIFIVFSCIQLFAVFLCFRNICKPDVESLTIFCSDKVFDLFSKWFPWHMCGAILLTLPMISVLVNFGMLSSLQLNRNEYYFSYLLFICVIHFCNFTQLNYWMKNVVVTLSAAFFIGIVVANSHQRITSDNLQSHLSNAQNISVQWNFLKALASLHPKDDSPNLFVPTNTTMYLLNDTNAGGPEINIHTDSRSLIFDNKTVIGSNRNQSAKVYAMNSFKDINAIVNQNVYNIEIYVDILLLVIMVWFLNYEFEINYRLSFHGNIVANRDKARVQNMKNQADWLLHNIIPKHVADQLKNTAKYSENHKNVGVIFASIVNFNEMYDESYLGGKEFLRVLNELIGDFDELLTRPEFESIEKIKTIGSTFMAASGLNPELRKEHVDPNLHLFALMDFAIAMQGVIDNFNKDLLEFNLILRVGYNFGDVTAGVIGTTKLYYDIWGDAVNIASRMDSTGVPGRIQIGEKCLEVLNQRYEFEARGSVYVKGKDHMNVYLLIKKISESEEIE